MRYKLSLTGGKDIIVDEKAKQKIQELWGGTNDKIIEVEGELIKTSAIKGIFKYYDEEKANLQTTDVLIRIDDEFSGNCLRLSKLTPQEKTEKEMAVRVMPGWKASGMSEDDAALADAYGEIMEFFIDNPTYPRCPLSVWWPKLREKLKEKPVVSRWYEYVARNDMAIEQWLKGRQL